MKSLAQLFLIALVVSAGVYCFSQIAKAAPKASHRAELAEVVAAL